MSKISKNSGVSMTPTDVYSTQGGPTHISISQFTARTPKELSLEKNARIHVLEVVNESYVRVQDFQGNIGLVPANFLQPISHAASQPSDYETETSIQDQGSARKSTDTSGKGNPKVFRRPGHILQPKLTKGQMKSIKRKALIKLTLPFFSAIWALLQAYFVFVLAFLGQRSALSDGALAFLEIGLMRIAFLFMTIPNLFNPRKSDSGCGKCLNATKNLICGQFAIKKYWKILISKNVPLTEYQIWALDKDLGFILAKQDLYFELPVFILTIIFSVEFASVEWYDWVRMGYSLFALIKSIYGLRLIYINSLAYFGERPPRFEGDINNQVDASFGGFSVCMLILWYFLIAIWTIMGNLFGDVINKANAARNNNN